MTLTLLHELKESIETFVSRAPWSQRHDYVPDHLLVRPVDAWSGDARAGALLFDGVFTKDGTHLTPDAHMNGAGWEPKGVDESWVSHIHGFTWLRDLREYSKEGGAARGQASAFAWMMCLAWIERYGCGRLSQSIGAKHKRRILQSFFYRPDIAGERLSMWIAMFEFFAPEHFEASGGEEWHDLFFEALLDHGKHLSDYLHVHAAGGVRDMGVNLYGLGALKGVKGLLYAGLALEDYDHWVQQALERLRLEIDAQILADGAHISRSPQTLLFALQILLDIRGALNSAGHVVPDSVQDAIERIGPAVRFYRYNDKQLGVFHGGQVMDTALIDSILAQTGARGKAVESLPDAGFERLSQGRSLLLFDCGGTVAKPYQQSMHKAPLSFELSYAKQRIFVNCGTHPQDSDWRAALSGVPAHTALSLTDDAGNAIDLCGSLVTLEGAKRSSKHDTVATKFDVLREDHANACCVEASHDGYVPVNGMHHVRRIAMSGDGHDIQGEDILELSNSVGFSALLRPLSATLRFHLHPVVTVSLINNGSEALLRLPGGVGWRFQHQGGLLKLEDSIYMGEGVEPRKMKQLVICGQVLNSYQKFQWSLRKEG